MKWFTTTQFGIELETLIIVPQTRNILINNNDKDDEDDEDIRDKDIRKNLSLYLAKSSDNENDPKFAFENEDGEIVDPNTYGVHKGKFDRWVVCFDQSVEYPGLPPNQFYTPISRQSKKEKENHGFLLNSTIASMFAIGWIPINNTELVSPVLTLGDYSQIEYVFEHLTKQTPPAPMFFHNTTTSTHVHMSIKNGEDNVFMDPINILKICCAWLSFEPLFFSFVAPWRQLTGYCEPMRESIGRWGDNSNNACRLIQHYADRYKRDKKNANDLKKLLHTLVSEFQGSNRYVALNLHNLVDWDENEDENEDEKGFIFQKTAKPLGTIECRILHGTSDKEEIINFVKLLSAFFQAAMHLTIDQNLKYVGGWVGGLVGWVGWLGGLGGWEDNNETHHAKFKEFLGEYYTPEIEEFCSQRKNMVAADPNQDLESEETEKYLYNYNYQNIFVDSEANTLYISFKNKRNELIFMGGNLNKGNFCEIHIEFPPLLAPDVKITLKNHEKKMLLSSVVLKRDEAKKLVKDLIDNKDIDTETNKEQMTLLGIRMTGGKIYLKNKNLKPLKKFIKTTRRYVGKDKVSRVIYVKGKAEYTKRKSVVGFEYVRIRVPKPRS
jgi:hypothetical protein